ncbi:hypothetical protein PVK06_020406 [Gossypium arboreum]|uniref:TauD/TfdA-like domain-containing protein n=1 Tax=Gossypium arboreum TaxID=29729 RepID=A0ABR0PMA2_GOSAR|nr:hypothetical protein PVK06_020406 [Gossypium arboreum]
MSYTEAISSVVEQCEWQIFCLHPNDVFSKVVKEFYAHLTSPENTFIYVRGASVLFDSDSINAKYSLFDGPDEHADFVKIMTAKRLNHMLTDNYVEGTKWTISMNDSYTINRELPWHSDPSLTSSPAKPNDATPSTSKNAFE